MKTLVAILSCSHHTLHGHNEVLRSTWLKNAKEFSEVEYRFFLGDGTQTSEDHTLLDWTWSNESPAYTQRKFNDPSIVGYTPKADEVLMKVSDRYEHMSYKLREALRWSTGNLYDYTFVCLTDTYVALDRLVNSNNGFDYCGTANGEHTAIGGGPGMWLSYRASELIVASLVTDWAYDRWVGPIMLANGIKPTHDPRYTNLDLGDAPPLPNNNVITSHISNCDRSVYSLENMFEVHCNYKGIENV